jgi:hypothetical protein
MKLQSKERVGAKIKKKYDEPKTPYQRLIESPKLDRHSKKKLKLGIQGKNPFLLRRELDRKLKYFFQMVDHFKRQDMAELTSDYPTSQPLVLEKGPAKK